MFGLFGFDPVSMSDEELLHKTVELHARLSWAARFAGSDTIQRLQEVLYSLDNERQERAYRGVFNLQQSLQADIIETDPDLALEHKREAEKPERGKAAPVHRPRVTITRSSRPVDTPVPTSTPIEPVEPTPAKDSDD